MTWLNSTLDWISSPTGSRLITSTILPFVAIVVAGVVAALIGRAMASRILEVREREAKAAAVTSLVAAARRSVEWSSLGGDELSHATMLADEAGIRLRLLPAAGAGLAAAWTEHEIASIRSNSATFRFQAEQTFADVRDRLVDWQAKPSRAKRLFRDDIERWKTEEPVAVAAPAPDLAAAVATAAAERDAAVAAATGSTPVVAAAPGGAAPAAPAATAGGSAAGGPAAAGSPAAAGADDASPWQNPPASSTAEPSPETTALATAIAGVAERSAAAPADSTSASTASAASAAEPADHTDTAEVERLREPAYSSPVSADAVRRRTSPEAAVPAE